MTELSSGSDSESDVPSEDCIYETEVGRLAELDCVLSKACLRCVSAMNLRVLCTKEAVGGGAIDGSFDEDVRLSRERR